MVRYIVGDQIKKLYHLLKDYTLFQGRMQGGGSGGSGEPPFFKLIIFIAWLGMHV